jgi:hypothetical protein
MVSKGWQTLRSNSKSRWALALGAVAAVIIISMLVGIISNKSENSFSVQNEAARNQAGLPAAAPGATTAAAATPVAGVSTASRASGNSAPAADASSGQSSSSNQPLPADRLIIRNATVSLTANDVEKTLLDVKALAAEKSGVVFQSNSSIRDDKTYATLTIQVPSSAFDDTMNRLRKLNGVKVESENTTSQDVTEEYVDLKAQLTNLQATETELVRLLSKTTSVAEVLSVQRELTNVRGEIDRRQGRINYLEKKTDMSSITVNILPVLPATTKTTGTNSWDPLEVLATAWAGSVKGLQGLYTVAITLGVWAIWLAPLFLIGYLVYRRLTRSKPASKPASDPTV